MKGIILLSVGLFGLFSWALYHEVNFRRIHMPKKYPLTIVYKKGPNAEWRSKRIEMSSNSEFWAKRRLWERFNAQGYQVKSISLEHAGV